MMPIAPSDSRLGLLHGLPRLAGDPAGAGGRQSSLRQQLLLASARAIELEPEPPRYHLFDGVLPRLASPLVVEFWADPQCRAAGEFEVVIGADRLRWSCKTFT